MAGRQNGIEVMGMSTSSKTSEEEGRPASPLHGFLKADPVTYVSLIH